MIFIHKRKQLTNVSLQYGKEGKYMKRKLTKRNLRKHSTALVHCYVNEGSQCQCHFNGCVAQCKC